MEKAKAFALRHFELAVVIILAIATGFLVLAAGNKVALLNFFYMPVLVAAYFLGRRQGVLVAAIAVLMVGVYAVLNPTMFSVGAQDIPELNIVLWGAFMILTALVVGSLYEVKESAVRDLRQAYQGVLAILGKFIDGLDSHTQEHSLRVADLASRTAAAMGLREDQIETIRVAGLLHDVGKIDVSLQVLKKASLLQGEEWDEIKSHIASGTAILKPVGGLLRDVVPIVECHHECFDGSGYVGVCGTDIPLGARILTVADSFDAIVCDRYYRAGKTTTEAIREIERCSGTQFDPDVVEAFKRVIYRVADEIYGDVTVLARDEVTVTV